MKTVIIVGAGATLSEAMGRSLKETPPLDSGFFMACEKIGYTELPGIKRYLINNYDLDPSVSEYDSLEKIMAVIYADINNPALQSEATVTFRNLIKLFNRRIAETTNTLNISNRSNLFRLLSKKLIAGVPPEDISIITFNQDIQIEKTLEKLQSTKKYAKLGTIFSFPNCYVIPNVTDHVSRAPKKQSKFALAANSSKGIPIYKLHGSLNWFSTHTSERVPKGAILSRTKKFKITPRRNIPVGMKYNTGKRRVYTFPLIIPPVNHKAAIIHDDLYPLWKEAEAKLKSADEIIIFGYSCPPTDFESVNLIRRATNSGTNPQSFVVIDPSPNTFHRYIDVTCLDHLSFFRSCDAYLEKG